MSRLPTALRNRVARRANKLCEYCRTFRDLTGHDFTIDHILPESLGGASTFDNLCLCCFWCNNFKQARTHALDSVTGQIAPLFHPREDRWEDHFRWDSTFSRLRGRTAIGRATVKLLRLNRASLVQARRIWVEHGLHPPA
ncbi:MAG: HNH endonuclease [Acidobacteriota bacterium]